MAGKGNQLFRRCIPCCLPTTRWRRSGSPTRTTSTSTTWPRVPTRSASGCPCRSTRTASSWARRSAEHLAAPHARDPRVQGQRCPFQLRRVHVRPQHQRGQHLRVWRQRHCPCRSRDPNSEALERTSRISPPTRTAMAASGAGRAARVQEPEAGRQRHRLHACVRFLRQPPFTSRWLIRCSWAKPTTSATPDAGGNRLRPQPAEARDPDFPIRGYEYYDYRHDVVNTTFVNYQDNACARRARSPTCCSPASGSALLPERRCSVRQVGRGRSAGGWRRLRRRYQRRSQQVS
jgi:hypothetical protein